jgi:hypothetical protein
LVMRTIALTKIWNRNKVYYRRYSVVLIIKWISIWQLVPVLFRVSRSSGFFRIKFRLFWQFLSTIFFYFSIMKSSSMYLLMYKFSGYLTELVLEIITVLFRAAKVFHTLQEQWIDMRVHVFAGASPEKHAQKSF